MNRKYLAELHVALASVASIESQRSGL